MDETGSTGDTKEFIGKAPSPSPSTGEGFNISPPLRGGDEGEGDVCGFTNDRISIFSKGNISGGHEILFSVIDHLPAFLYLQEKDYSIKLANRYFIERFGDHRDKTCYQIFHRSEKPCEKCPTSWVFNTKIPCKHEWEAPDGYIYQIYSSPFIDIHGNELVIKLGVDITNRKKMDEENIRVRNLESIGTLAGGIAHDFNNILTSILGNISLARMISHPENKVTHLLTEAETSSLQARDLIQRLITFAGGNRPFKMKVSIQGLLKGMVEFALGNSGVKREFSLPDDLWPVEVDVEQISQVISNLVVNAREVLPGGGTISVGAENYVVSPEHAIPLNAGRYVKISFKDDGAGIKKEHLQKIFDPYFTTKYMGYRKGTGLGLSVCHSIVKNHGGYITAESKLGAGTTFYIYLPAFPDGAVK